MFVSTFRLHICSSHRERQREREPKETALNRVLSERKVLSSPLGTSILDGEFFCFYTLSKSKNPDDVVANLGLFSSGSRLIPLFVDHSFGFSGNVGKNLSFHRNFSLCLGFCSEFLCLVSLG